MKGIVSTFFGVAMLSAVDTVLGNLIRKMLVQDGMTSLSSYSEVLVSSTESAFLEKKIENPLCGENPFQIGYTLPEDKNAKPTAKYRGKVPYVLNILKPFELGEICCNPEVDSVKPLNQPSDAYLVVEQPKTGNKQVRVNGTYVTLVREMEKRVVTVLLNNLKPVLWLDLVNLFNANPALRTKVLGDKDTYQDLINHADAVNQIKNVITAAKSASPSASPQLVQALEQTYQYLPNLQPEKLELKVHFKNTYPTQPAERTCVAKDKTVDVKELGVACIKKTMAQVSTRWQQYETLIDYIRTKLGAPKRTCSKLLNPLSRWTESSPRDNIIA